MTGTSDPLSEAARERSFPTGLGQSRVPLTIVTGPSGGGKSTFVRRKAAPSDLIISFDIIRDSLRPAFSAKQSGALLEATLNARNDMLRSLSASPTFAPRAWFIVSAPDPTERERWLATLGGEMVLVAPSLATCFDRIRGDLTRQYDWTRRMRLADQWWKANPDLAPTEPGLEA